MKEKLVMNAVSGGILFQIKFESLDLSEVECSNFIVSLIVNILNLCTMFILRSNN